MSLATICQGAAASLGLAQPDAFVGSADPAALLFLSCAQREGKQLSKRHNWQALIVQKTWTSTATVIQADAVGTDFDRTMIDTQVWNRTSNALYSGPTDARIWQELQLGTNGGVAGWWRLIGGDLNLYPAPSASLTFAWEYISKNWSQSGLSVAQSAWAADADTALLPEDLMELGVSWRYARAKGWDYAEEMATYEREVEKAASRDRGFNVMAVNAHIGDEPNWAGVVVE